MSKESIRKRKRGSVEWLSFTRKGVGYFAYTMQRISGLVLVIYLYLHLFTLSSLLKGPSYYNSLVQNFAQSDLFRLVDVLLGLVIFYHGANGIRLALNELGYGLKYHKVLFYVFETIAMVLLAIFLYYAYMSLPGVF